MADHDELVAEMLVLEQMGTQERQKLAKKRRLQQLKKWTQREKEWIAKEKQLNKRLANIINEENNGLNLKQYTSYNSNQRKKKSSSIGFIHNDVNSKSSNSKLQSLSAYDSLTSNGKIHFDVGVMLLEAAARNDFDEVKRLLSLGVSPDSINHDGLTALHQCCIDASEPMMRLLLEYGANVDARDTEQWTPLHAACTCGHLNLVEILVQYGADLLAVNGDGNMPFDICEDEATLGHIESEMIKKGITQEMIDLKRASAEMQMLDELEERLRQNGENDLNVGDKNGVTYLHIAAANNYISIVKFMLKHGVNVNICDNDHWTPLHGAACWGSDQHIKVVELLVEAGARLDAKTLNDETVFDLCDNIDLLEKLNQLKDEIESRQANNGGDKLRRTQSRTNSRVHSVRRTSVRDKNQISRREAREEALLRVGSETTSELNPTEPSSNQPVTNGNSQSPAKENDHPIILSQHTQNSDDKPDKSELGKVKAQPVSTDLDILNEKQSNEANNNSKCSIVNGENISINGSQSDSSKPENNRLVQDEALFTTNNSTDHHGQNRQGYRSTKTTDINVTNSYESINNKNGLNGSIIIRTNASLNGDSSIHLPMTNQVTTMNTIPMNNQHSNLINMTMQQPDSISDQPSSISSRSLSQTTTVQVQFAPTNYTLSNLKKHRSDLRMRTCTIGGNSNGNHSNSSVNQTIGETNNLSSTALPSIASNTPTHTIVSIESSNPTAAVLTASSTPHIIPESKHNDSSRIIHPDLNDTREHRSGSPSSSFKKFHGEPSEVVGNFKRKKNCKWCIII